MAAPECITERNSFGHWLSGFTDGEGSFALRVAQDNRRRHLYWLDAIFSIGLRADDTEVLSQIKEFWQVGVIYAKRPHSSGVGNGKPQSTFRIRRIKDFVNVVIPHFDHYPLRAKKRRDYVIWKEAVDFLWKIHQRPREGLRDRRGMKRRYTDAEIHTFSEYCGALKAQRVYDAPEMTSPPPIAANRSHSQLSLEFD